ncbi:ABC transporter ATP-binding protein [uncultured Dialister sp.]|uniref:ABC transporter ATP-binding protein n=1 Tax=uncultured Dialister sp. TaxID=278064 RepID=UPI0025E45539|nr:ABC transporter ATP-binding protein [uncultured Dialister sp.]
MDAMIDVENLTIKFGGVTAVNNVSFHLGKGEVLGVIGPNGSGKTTLFNLLSGIYKPTFGTIRLNGKTISGLSADTVFNCGISRTFQNGRLFWKMNVLENIMIGISSVRHTMPFASLLPGFKAKKLEEEAIDKAYSIMQIFGDLLTSQSDKLAKELPYADRRRLEICRAIASEPKVLLLDEPSAGMDNLETEKLMEDLLKVKKARPDLTMIVVEHDMGFIKGLVDKVMVLNYGNNIAFGLFDDVAHDDAVITAYLGRDEKDA